jgi:hypothetical protein
MIRVNTDAKSPICDRLRPKLIDNSLIEGANLAILMPLKVPQNKMVIVSRKSRAKDGDGIAMICLKTPWLALFAVADDRNQQSVCFAVYRAKQQAYSCNANR